MTTSLLKLERRIAADERGGIHHRWEYGRELLKAKAGRRKLPDGMLADLVAAASKIGLRISEREIQRRIKCAEVYDHDLKLRQALTEYGSWTEIVNAGFPEVTVDEDLIEPEDLEPPTPDEFEQLSLLPGFKPTIRLHGREIRIAEATVPDLLTYRDKYRAMHEGFGKTLALIEATVEAIIEGWDGSPTTLAVDCYLRGAS